MTTNDRAAGRLVGQSSPVILVRRLRGLPVIEQVPRVSDPVL